MSTQSDNIRALLAASWLGDRILRDTLGPEVPAADRFFVRPEGVNGSRTDLLIISPDTSGSMQDQMPALAEGMRRIGAFLQKPDRKTLVAAFGVNDRFPIVPFGPSAEVIPQIVAACEGEAHGGTKLAYSVGVAMYCLAEQLQMLRDGRVTVGKVTYIGMTDGVPEDEPQGWRVTPDGTPNPPKILRDLLKQLHRSAKTMVLTIADPTNPALHNHLQKLYGRGGFGFDEHREIFPVGTDPESLVRTLLNATQTAYGSPMPMLPSPQLQAGQASPPTSPDPDPNPPAADPGTGIMSI